jgi:hypothetical protein
MLASEMGFSHFVGRSPLQFFPSPGIPHPRRWTGYPIHPLVVFPNEVFTFALASLGHLQRFAAEKVGLPVSRLPARSRFQAVR